MIVALDKRPKGMSKEYRNRYPQLAVGLTFLSRRQGFGSKFPLCKVAEISTASKEKNSLGIVPRPEKDRRRCIADSAPTQSPGDALTIVPERRKSGSARHLARRMLVVDFDSVISSCHWGHGPKSIRTLREPKMNGIKSTLIGVVLGSSGLAWGACSVGDLGSLLSLIGPTGLTAEIASKAEAVARQIGGPGGFGGEMMDGFAGHMPQHMGFHNETSLVGPGGSMLVGLFNESSQDCVFHLSYVSSQMGATEQMMDVTVAGGGEVTVQMPCSEIVGMGPMEMPGQPGCHLADGQPVGNAMSTPGFMGMNYSCGEEYAFRLMADINDLDGDGDLQELIIMSQAMEQFMKGSFPMGMGSMMGSMMGW